MSDECNSVAGYLYVLEVADIDLPVCKIGMTTRNPYDRCSEINKSSTGDFIWEVAHHFFVSDCRELESLVHTKMAPLRQKRREFFNVDADTAYKAILSIIESQKKIEIINTETDVLPEKIAKTKNIFRKREKFKGIDATYAELLQVFAAVLQIKGRTFGRLSKNFGMSDGAEGVQWNLGVSALTGMAQIGVNLEGLKYRNWPIADFILSELKSPRIEWVRSQLLDASEIKLSLSRDAWQMASRPEIVEKYCGGGPLRLSDISSEDWQRLLVEALGCLNKESDYRGRAIQQVTVKKRSTQENVVQLMEVSPHLWIGSSVSLEGDVEENVRQILSSLMPVYDWVAGAIKPPPSLPLHEGEGRTSQPVR